METCFTNIDEQQTVVAGCLSTALLHFESVLENRLSCYFNSDNSGIATSPFFPEPNKSDSLGQFIIKNQLDAESQLLLLLVLVPYIKPDLFDEVIQSVMPGAGDYSQLGGVRGGQHRGFLPTGDTALFLLAGNDIGLRQFWQKQLLGTHSLVLNGTVYLDATKNNEPPMSARLMLDPETAELLITGAIKAPRMSLQFPAQQLTSELGWHNLVLPSQTMAQVKELEEWVANAHILMEQWAMKTKLRPGLRVLFYGPPGTGKTFTATLLGKITGHEVYKVDLSMVVSKYIGETEKNLATLFDKAEHKNWILFFDEADALFGKRTQVRDAHDRYANQEVSFLLQRIETYDGLIILASNLANNVDEAFARRFEQVVHFPKPRKGERLRLWKNSLPEKIILEPGFDLPELANRYEVSGGTIMNVVRHVCMQAISRNENILRMDDFKEGIRREYAKENRVGS